MKYWNFKNKKGHKKGELAIDEGLKGMLKSVPQKT